MTHHGDEGHDVNVATHQRIEIPSIAPVTADELARRAKLFAEIDRIREEIGPIGVDVVDLIDADFYELATASE